MKLANIPVLLLTGLFVLVYSSCKKDTPVAATYTVPGLWTGTYTVDQLPAQSPLFYAFAFKSNNTLITESKGSNGVSYYSQGTWVLSGTDITCNYSSINFPTSVTQSAKLTFNSTSDTLSSGTWKDGSGGSGYTGKFQLIKKVN